MQIAQSPINQTRWESTLSIPLVLFLCFFTFFATPANAKFSDNHNPSIDSNIAKPAKPIYGVLWDEETHEPVAYANVFYKGTSLGIYTDFEGQFDVGYRPWPSDTIEFVYMGYETITILLDTVKTLPMQLYFKRKIDRIESASIHLGINPAMIWVNLAQKNRSANSPDRIKSYECEVFSKTTVAINNISKNLKKSKLTTEVGSYFDTISYLTGDSNKAILPVLFSEVLSDFSFQRNPRLSKEYV
ncbi:MAG: carboxypeptidase-like regulatory domain-containing protein, partial [Crocinitomicaceae bacterium]